MIKAEVDAAIDLTEIKMVKILKEKQPTIKSHKRICCKHILYKAFFDEKEKC